MIFKKQEKFRLLVKRVAVICFIFSTVLLVSPSLNSTLTFAFTYIESPKVSTDSVKTPAIIDGNFKDLKAMPAQKPVQKSRAPEFSSLFILLSGVMGMLVRFIRKSFERIKRTTDLGLALILLVICSPALVIAGILIKLTSKGPIIYRQDRVGRFGKVFKIYKLRTMYVNAEKGLGAVWAKKDDPRITPIGGILRKLHIDEMPQLLNVLVGEMSIVGPRPERPELVRDLKTLICDYEKRLIVNPGITGLAQVWHKYDETLEDVKKKIKYDLLYIRKMCLMTDLRIFFRTFLVVLSGRQAQ